MKDQGNKINDAADDLPKRAEKAAVDGSLDIRGPQGFLNVTDIGTIDVDRG